VVRKVLSALMMLLGTMVLGSMPAPSGAAAQGLCNRPSPPPPLNGAEANAEQLRVAIARARDFIGQANLYERCLKDETEAAHASASVNGTAADPAADQDVEAQIAANRRLKDKVSSDAAMAMDIYKKTHAN
jgi:hypothetical protein